MAYTKTITTSYGQRLKNSGKGIVGGLAMFAIGTILLFWNEQRTAKQYRAIKETAKVCVEMPSADEINPDFNGKCVHTIATASTEDILTDNYFGVSVNAIAIDRNTEYYQWVEHESRTTRDKVGGGEETVITYSYSKEWCRNPVSTSNFENMVTQQGEYMDNTCKIIIPTEGESQTAAHVAFGAYRLPEKMKSAFHCDYPMDLSNLSVPGASVIGNVVYYGANSNVPQVGDVRVTLTKSVASAEASVIGVVMNDTFTDYVAKNGNANSWIQLGAQSTDQMIATAKQNNKILGWVLRVIGALLVVFGLKGIFEILVTLLKVLPFLANIMNVGVSAVCWLVGLAWSFLVAAIAWLIFHPAIGVPLVVVSVALIVYLGMKSKKAQPAGDAPLETPAPSAEN